MSASRPSVLGCPHTAIFRPDRPETGLPRRVVGTMLRGRLDLRDGDLKDGRMNGQVDLTQFAEEKYVVGQSVPRKEDPVLLWGG
jgi:hypothetical protein